MVTVGLGDDVEVHVRYLVFLFGVSVVGDKGRKATVYLLMCRSSVVLKNVVVVGASGFDDCSGNLRQDAADRCSCFLGHLVHGDILLLWDHERVTRSERVDV